MMKRTLLAAAALTTVLAAQPALAKPGFLVEDQKSPALRGIDYVDTGYDAAKVESVTYADGKLAPLYAETAYYGESYQTDGYVDDGLVVQGERPDPNLTVQQIAVPIDDLDLRYTADVETADARLKRAVRSACGYMSGSSLNQLPDYRQCYATAYTAAQVDLTYAVYDARV